MRLAIERRMNRFPREQICTEGVSAATQLLPTVPRAAQTAPAAAAPVPRARAVALVLGAGGPRVGGLGPRRTRRRAPSPRAPGSGARVVAIPRPRGVTPTPGAGEVTPIKVATTYKMTTRSTPLQGSSSRNPTQPHMEENSPALMFTPRSTIDLSTTVEGTPLSPLIPVHSIGSKVEDGGTLFKRTQARACALQFKGEPPLRDYRGPFVTLDWEGNLVDDLKRQPQPVPNSDLRQPSSQRKVTTRIRELDSTTRLGATTKRDQGCQTE